MIMNEGMDGFVCENCGLVFEQPHKECIGAAVFAECPQCHSSAFVATMLCGNCGHYIRGDYVRTAWGEFLCDDCYEEGNIFE